MPRRNRPERSDRSSGSRPSSSSDQDRESGGWFGLEDRETDSVGEWIVRPVSGAAAVKTYRCPGCDHEIPAGVPHVVAWRADGVGSVEDRRHWHRACWNNRGNRRLGRRQGR
ncbi:ATP/GTP-binding protein [Yinghuangia seranimata]|nr:ATP/GTP-binding protein [Yinghuangia seranimata]MDI2128221.1 ATP/GTP-binding protein [Yinghuangia seranimata]